MIAQLGYFQIYLHKRGHFTIISLRRKHNVVGGTNRNGRIIIILTS